MKKLRGLSVKFMFITLVVFISSCVSRSSYFDEIILQNLKQYEDIAEIYDYRKIKEYNEGNKHIVVYQYKVKLKTDKVLKEAQTNILDILKKSPFLVELSTRCGINFITGKQPCIIEDKAIFKKTANGWILK